MSIIETVPWLNRRKGSLEKYDYVGYNKKFLLKSDLTPKTLKKFGIKASVKDIKTNYKKASTGDCIITGGHGYSKKCETYSIKKLKDIFGQ